MIDAAMSSLLEEVLAKHGGRYAISQDPVTGMWLAEDEDGGPTFLRHTLAQLDSALDQVHL